MEIGGVGSSVLINQFPNTIITCVINKRLTTLKYIYKGNILLVCKLRTCLRCYYGAYTETVSRIFDE